MLFRALYCKRFDCPDSEFETDLVWRFLCPRAKQVMPFLLRLDPEFLFDEMALALALGRQRHMPGVRLELDLYHAKVVSPSFLRRYMGMRISCRTLSAFAEALLRGHGEDPGVSWGGRREENMRSAQNDYETSEQKRVGGSQAG